MLALAVVAQPHVATPERAPSVAQLRIALEAAGGGPRWDEEEVQALVASLRYARALPLATGDLVRSALGTPLTLLR